jgi:hypothetical protein
MMKRLSLLLAALFVGATLFAAPVIASGNSDNKNNNDNDKVCILRHQDDNGKDYRWVWDIEDLHVGDKVVKDKYCEHKDNNGEHKDNNGEHKDNNGEHKNNSDNNNGDDNGNANDMNAHS